MPAKTNSQQHQPFIGTQDSVLHASRGWESDDAHAEDNDAVRKRLKFSIKDVFVAVTSTLILVGIYWASRLILNPIVAECAALFTAWMLAERYVRERRMALTAMILLAAVSNCAFDLAQAISTAVHMAEEAALLTGVVAGVLFAVFYFLRFRVPAALALVYLVVEFVMFMSMGLLLLGSMPMDVDRHFIESDIFLPALAIYNAVGFVTLAFAIFWDTRSAQRPTQQSDIAFWLYLMGFAHLIGPGLFLATMPEGAKRSAFSVIMLLVNYAILATVLLATHRRGFCIVALLSLAPVPMRVWENAYVPGTGIQLTTVIIAIVMFSLIVRWAPCRRFMLDLLPLTVAKRLPSCAPAQRPRGLPA